MAKKNFLTHSKKLKAEAAYRGNRLEEAKSLYEAVCRADKADVEAWTELAVIHRKLKQFDAAERYARQALTLQPQSAEAHHALGAALQCLGNMDEAIACYQAAVRLKPNFAEAHYFLANAYKDGLNGAAAEAHYKEAIALRPGYLEALSNLGALLTPQDRTSEALDYLNQALVLAPHAPQVLCNIGSILLKEERLEEGRAKLNQALVYAPDFVDALVILAEIEEKANRPEEAGRLVERGLGLVPDSAGLRLTAAKLALTEGRTQEGIDFLENVQRSALPTVLAGNICYTLGKLYDRAKMTDQAYAAFVEANQLVVKRMGEVNFERGAYLRQIDRARDFLTDALCALPPLSRSEGAKSPVFLYGFARSGTTLLDQVLDSHPAFQTLSEKPTVETMWKAFLEMAGDKPDALALLDDAQIDRLRAVYFRAASDYVTLSPNAVLVDKMPLNTVQAHLIWRVFPDSKVILAIRHPCDVCLSCFMQHFTINEAMSVFVTLEDTASLYARVMDFWRECAKRLPIQYHQVRYEDLVEDFEGQTRQLLDFLGVGWDDAVLGYSEHAKKRVIRTPSYHQVTQPIYKHASYRWKRYAKQMGPVMETLKPFIDYFGYAEDA